MTATLIEAWRQYQLNGPGPDGRDYPSLGQFREAHPEYGAAPIIPATLAADDPAQETQAPQLDVKPMTPAQIAIVAHQVNRAYCQALGDHSQPAWEDAPQWQRDSALLGVQLHTENPDASLAASHESWMAQKVADGWTYGPEKLPDLKQHPCIVPFDQLPREQQAKDYIFRGVVHALAHAPAAIAV